MNPGDSTANIDISLPYFEVNETISSSRYRWNCHDRGPEPFVIVQWTHSGEGVFTNALGARRVPAGHAFLAVVPEASSYYYPPEAREPWVFTWTNWYGTFACELFRRFQSRFGSVVPLSPRGAAAAALRRAITAASKDAASGRSHLSLLAYAFVLEWWREAAAPGGASDNRLARTVQFCRQHFREPLGVKEIAHEAGMSREHFTRLFLQEMKQPPAAFLRHLRVSEAATLLRETELPVREVAMRSGFYSTRQLMRTFQRVHGLGPAAFRLKGAAAPPTGSRSRRGQKIG